MTEPVPAPGDAAIRRFLIFRSGTQSYALPAEEVTEIIVLPPVVRLPQSPPALLGMANLRGSVIAVASLRALLGQVAGPPSARAILLGGAAPVALSIDRVDSLVSLEAKQIETRQTELASAPGEKLRGAFQPDLGGEVTKILDIQPLLAAAFAPAVPRAHKIAVWAARGELAPEHAPAALQMLVSFDIAGQEYALPLDEAREIIPLPPAMALLPRSEALLLGVVSLRGTLLPLLSLRGLLGFPLHHDQSGQAKIIVTLVAGVLAGLVVDNARTIVQAAPGAIQPAPAMLAARMGGETRIQSIYRDAGNGRIVPILSTGSLFGEDIMARLTSTAQQAAATPAKTAAMGPIRQFLVFRLGGEEFGLPIAAVDEVAAAPEKITRLPKTPKFLEGIINLRGDVLPVIDQRQRFDLAKYAGPPGRQRLVVTRTQRHRAGLLVDAVSDVLSAAEHDIEPAPSLTGESISLVNGVLNLQPSGRIILLLNPDELLNRAERGLLDKFAAAQKPPG